MRSPRYYAQSIRGGYWNRRNTNAIARGKGPRRAAVAAAVKSRTPIFRDRINPAHGNKHREDARLHRLGNESLARTRRAQEQMRQRMVAERNPARIFRVEPRDAKEARSIRRGDRRLRRTETRILRKVDRRERRHRPGRDAR